MNQSKLVGIELFSGAGGMSIGTIAAAIDVKVAVEIDKYAAIAYTMNHPDKLMINDDVRKVKLDAFG